MGLPLIDCLDYRLVASYVESIGDCAVRMAKSVVEFVNTALPEDFTRLLYEAGEASYKMHETAIKAIFSRDLNLVGEVMRLNEQARGLLKGLEVQLSGRNAEVIAYSSSISSSLRSIADYCVDLADIVMPR
jgi:phosphate uptake regulator